MSYSDRNLALILLWYNKCASLAWWVFSFCWMCSQAIVSRTWRKSSRARRKRKTDCSCTTRGALCSIFWGTSRRRTTQVPVYMIYANSHDTYTRLCSFILTHNLRTCASMCHCICVWLVQGVHDVRMCLCVLKCEVWCLVTTGNIVFDDKSKTMEPLVRTNQPREDEVCVCIFCLMARVFLNLPQIGPFMI